MIADYAAWVVLLRPQQATLGALVLACKEPVSSFGEVSAAACAELATVCADIEAALGKGFAYAKINYLMLMMVDPDVHFHVLPRYSAPQTFSAIEFADPGWPGPPRLDFATDTGADLNAQIANHLKGLWGRDTAGT